MIPSNEIECFIKKITDIKSGKYSDYISKTRDVFDARLYSFTNKTQNWLFGAVVGEMEVVIHSVYQIFAMRGVFVFFHARSYKW